MKMLMLVCRLLVHVGLLWVALFFTSSTEQSLVSVALAMYAVWHLYAVVSL